MCTAEFTECFLNTFNSIDPKESWVLEYAQLDLSGLTAVSDILYDGSRVSNKLNEPSVHKTHLQNIAQSNRPSGLVNSKNNYNISYSAGVRIDPNYQLFNSKHPNCKKDQWKYMISVQEEQSIIWKKSALYRKLKLRIKNVAINVGIPKKINFLNISRTEVRVIDSYIRNATVRVFNPSDYSNEFTNLTGTTDANGSIRIDINEARALGLSHLKFKVIGGEDIATGKAFIGEMTAIGSIYDNPIVITPLTTIVEKLYVPNNKVTNITNNIKTLTANIENKLGLNSGDITKDPISTENSNTFKAISNIAHTKNLIAKNANTSYENISKKIANSINSKTSAQTKYDFENIIEETVREVDLKPGVTEHHLTRLGTALADAVICTHRPNTHFLIRDLTKINHLADTIAGDINSYDPNGYRKEHIFTDVSNIGVTSLYEKDHNKNLDSTDYTIVEANDVDGVSLTLYRPTAYKLTHYYIASNDNATYFKYTVILNEQNRYVKDDNVPEVYIHLNHVIDIANSTINSTDEIWAMTFRVTDDIDYANTKFTSRLPGYDFIHNASRNYFYMIWNGSDDISAITLAEIEDSSNTTLIASGRFISGIPYYYPEPEPPEADPEPEMPEPEPEIHHCPPEPPPEPEPEPAPAPEPAPEPEPESTPEPEPEPAPEPEPEPAPEPPEPEPEPF